MLTTRGWWFLVLLLSVGTVGGVMSLREAPSLLLIVMALSIWFLFEWVTFYWRAKLIAPNVSITRVVRDERGPVTNLWAGKSFGVELQADLPGGRLPMAVLFDRMPIGAEVVEGDRRWEGGLGGGRRAVWGYRFRCPHLGVARFEGVRLRFADLQGFFYHELFVRVPIELPVLPVLTERGSARRADKRFNLLPPPGVHRHRRPGTGSELLELRDYQLGDPPRRIAWKVSARRDQLITREYESEVPLRCTLLLDASNATRLGPPGESALAQLCAIAATVTQAAIGNRDLVGLAVCDEHGVEFLAPARTSSQLVQILQALARTAPLPPVAVTGAVEPLLTRAAALANDLYPDLMDPAVNRFPWWLPWLSPPPHYVDRPGKTPRYSYVRRWRGALDGTVRRNYGWRKRLAALLTVKYGLPTGATALLLEDDPSCVAWLQRFLAEHRVPYDVPVTDERGADVLYRYEPLDLQARALTRAVSHGRDNELYVLLGEYVQRSTGLTALLKAVRVARSRHHHVLVVQPGRPPADPGAIPNQASVATLLKFAECSRAERGWRNVRRSFGRLGAMVVPAASGDPARLILHRLEQLRYAQGTSRA